MKRRLSLIAAVVAVGVVGWANNALQPRSEADCPTVTTADLSSPFETGVTTYSDARLNQLADALALIGKPIGAVGYSYDRWLNLAAVGDSFIAWTKRDSVWTVLDANSLKPHWAGTSPKAGMTWDANSDRFFTIGAGKQVTVAALRIKDGHQSWCTTLPSRAKPADIATAPTADGGLIVAIRSKAGSTLTRLSGKDGAASWSSRTPISTDSLVLLDDQNLLAGGRDYGSEADPASDRVSDQLGLFSLRDGNLAASPDDSSRANVRIIGQRGDEALIAKSTPTSTELSLLDTSGRIRSVVTLPGAGDSAQMTLRGDTLLTRNSGPDGDVLTGFDIDSGASKWTQQLPKQPQFFPYGYDLASAPSLDGEHLLLGATSALVVLDVHTGAMQQHPLPTDGIKTTFWPYQLALTPTSTAVVTNTGAVVVAGRP